MDTEAFRKAYTDYRKVEASVLSAQSKQWTMHAERSANSIDLATIKRPMWHVPYAGFAPVNTMETKKLYPKKVSGLMPLSSSYTVNPTESTERLFLDQWHQGLGLPMAQDDKALFAFKVGQKRQFIDNFRSVMENTRVEEFKNVDGNRILGLCRNFFGAIQSSKTRGPLLKIANEVYDQLVLNNAKLSPQSITPIYEQIDKITNKKNSGKLDIRLEQERQGLPKEQASPVQPPSQPPTSQAVGGAQNTPASKNPYAPSSASSSNPYPQLDKEPTVGVIKNQGQPVEPSKTSTPSAPPAPGAAAAPGATPPGIPAQAVAAVTTPPVPLVPVTNDPLVQDTGLKKEDTKPLTLTDLLTMQSLFQKSQALLENAYIASSQGVNITMPSGSYSTTDSVMPRGPPTGSQRAYVEQLNATTQKIQSDNAQNTQIQTYMSQGMSDKQAREKVAEDTRKSREQAPAPEGAAASIVNNMEEQARQVNTNNAQLLLDNVKSPLPVTTIPPTPTQPPPQATPGQQVSTEVPPVEEEDETPTPPAPVTLPPVQQQPVVPPQNTNPLFKPPPPQVGETAGPKVTIYSDFKDQIPKLKALWTTGKDLKALEYANEAYKTFGAKAPENGQKDGAVSKHSFFFQNKSAMYSTYDKLNKIGFFDVKLPDNLPAETFQFIAKGFTGSNFVRNWPKDQVPGMDTYRQSEGVKQLVGMGKRARSRSPSNKPKRSKVSYAPGYKSKKERKLQRKK